MKFATVLCALVFGVTTDAAPAAQAAINEEELTNSMQELQRPKRSHYGPSMSSGGYIQAPCAAAPIAPSPYHMNLGPASLHGPAAGYGYGAHGLSGSIGYGGYGLPHYRADDLVEEADTFREMEHEHIPMMRAYGGYEGGLSGASHIGFGGGLGALPSVAAGPALGIFPGANVGGCNVPLLLSCSPSIVTGKIVKSHPHYGTSGLVASGIAAAPAYRGNSDLNAAKDAHVEDHTSDATGPDHHSVSNQEQTSNSRSMLTNNNH